MTGLLSVSGENFQFLVFVKGPKRSRYAFLHGLDKEETDIRECVYCGPGFFQLKMPDLVHHPVEVFGLSHDRFSSHLFTTPIDHCHGTDEVAQEEA